MYEPREDSFLILKQIGKYATGTVLDMGTGSGILAKEASKTANVTAIDINPEAKKYCKGIKFIVSDLFSNVKGKFDLIIFNPPYLPNDPRVEDVALDGGEKGYEIIEKFLKNAHEYLSNQGKILLLFSSLTGKEKVEDIIKKKRFYYKELSRQKLHYEELYVYLIDKNEPK
ncbi:methyltransferase [Candidatus Woesearchaeota archaeon]|nr:methyltransferase [Candidatus Woesearchaeota archaeon]